MTMACSPTTSRGRPYGWARPSRSWRRRGYERIHVIGHSLGGLITRYYVQRLGGDSRVHTLVTLGTPHQGTQLARAAPLLPLVRQLTPLAGDSGAGRAGTGCRTRFIAFHSDIDPVCRAQRQRPARAS